MSKSYYIDANTIKVFVDMPTSRKKNVKVNKPIRSKVETHITRWYSAKARSIKKGIAFSLDLDDIRILINSPCIYCGSSAKLSEIDRKDSSLGYTKDNIVPACRRCNTIKNNVVSYDEMMKIVDILEWRR